MKKASGLSTGRRLLALSPRDRQLLFEAWWTLLAAATRLRLAPRRTVARALGGSQPPAKVARKAAGTSQGSSQGAVLSKSCETAGTSPPPQAVALAVSRAAAHHLGAMTCLPRAIALQRMLARRGIPATLRIGVRKAPEDAGGARTIAAHAWVEVDGIALGEPEAIAERFLPLLPPPATLGTQGTEI